MLQFVAPCSVISYCYTRVSYVLRNRLRSRRLVHAASAVLADEASAAGDANGLGALRPQVLRERDLAEIRRKRRTNRMLVSMVLVFCCCWIPLNAIHIVGDILDKCAPALLPFLLLQLLVFPSVLIEIEFALVSLAAAGTPKPHFQTCVPE